MYNIQLHFTVFDMYSLNFHSTFAIYNLHMLCTIYKCYLQFACPLFYFLYYEVYISTVYVSTVEFICLLYIFLVYCTVYMSTVQFTYLLYSLHVY